MVSVFYKWPEKASGISFWLGLLKGPNKEVTTGQAHWKEVPCQCNVTKTEKTFLYIIFGIFILDLFYFIFIITNEIVTAVVRVIIHNKYFEDFHQIVGMIKLLISFHSNKSFMRVSRYLVQKLKTKEYMMLHF